MKRIEILYEKENIEDKYPFDLYDYYCDLGYKLFHDAKSFLFQNFRENHHYVVFRNIPKNPNDFTDFPAKGGCPDETVKMAFHCLYDFFEIAGTS